MDYTEVTEIAKEFTSKKDSNDNYDDSSIDRLHNRYTVAFILCFCIAASTYDYMNDAIKCWVPAQLASNYQDFIDSLCFIQNTYFVPKSEYIPSNVQARSQRQLKYYQWIYIVLFIQAFFFLLPRLIWQRLNHQIGIPIRSLIEASDKAQLMASDRDRHTMIKFIADCLERYEEYVQSSSKDKRKSCKGSSLAHFYILIKFLYMLNLSCQLIFLQYFLRYHQLTYFQYGWNMLRNIYHPSSQIFPRLTLCDFQIRELGIQHLYTVECVLVLNLFLEKLYLLIWIWFNVLFILTIVDTIRWIYRIYFRHSRNQFIRKHIELTLEKSLTRHKQFHSFLHYFPIDNLFTLKMMSNNSSSTIVADVLYELFQRKIQHNSDV